MRKINEIFYSLPGRGLSYGFRLFLCVSRLQPEMFFATRSTKRGGCPGNLAGAVGKYPAVTVILTGGEPSLWIDREFVDCLHRMGKYVCIENERYASLAG